VSDFVKTWAINMILIIIYLARNSIYAIARYMLSPVRPSVCHMSGSVKNG